MVVGILVGAGGGDCGAGGSAGSCAGSCGPGRCSVDRAGGNHVRLRAAHEEGDEEQRREGDEQEPPGEVVALGLGSCCYGCGLGGCISGADRGGGDIGSYGCSGAVGGYGYGCGSFLQYRTCCCLRGLHGERQDQ